MRVQYPKYCIPKFSCDIGYCIVKFVYFVLCMTLDWVTNSFRMFIQIFIGQRIYDYTIR